MSTEYEAANVIFPAINKAASDPRGARARIAVLAVTTASQNIDLTNYLTSFDDGHFLTLVATGADVYFAFSDSNVSAVDETITAPGAVTLCQCIPNGQRWDGRVPDLYKYLVIKGSAAGLLRVSVSSLRPGQSISQGDA